MREKVGGEKMIKRVEIERILERVKGEKKVVGKI